MSRRLLCTIVLLGAGAPFARSADVAPGQFDSLVKNSPFGQGVPGGGIQTGQASPLEFRSVFTEKGEYYFSVYETATRSSRWVGLKEAGQPFEVVSYDRAKGTIQVVYRNQPLTLTLKQAQIIVQAPSPVMPSPGTPTGIPVNAVAPGSPDESARLAQVAEEIRRRRALRAQGPVPRPTTTPGPGPVPSTTSTSSGPTSVTPVPAKP